MKHIKWPSIGQFRSVIKNVEHRSAYVGMDNNGDAIYNKLLPKPTLKFEGTCKLHGTNSAVGISPSCEFWAQSRENIITPERDNAGFAMFAYANQEIFQKINTEVLATMIIAGINPGNRDTLIFGEWAGKGIQKGVAVAELPKMFVIFGIALVDDEGQKIYLTRKQIEEVMQANALIRGYHISDTPIYHIWDFDTFMIDIDFENPHEAQNELNRICGEIEQECPVAKAFGVSGIGEGLVIRCITPGYEDSGFWAKIKGSKHSNSKVKTLATVDVERINNIKELAEKLAHNGRLEQMYQQVFDTLNGGEPDIKRMGELIKAVMSDVFKEELDTIAASGFTGKEINGPISKIVREFLLKKLEI